MPDADWWPPLPNPQHKVGRPLKTFVSEVSRPVSHLVNHKRVTDKLQQRRKHFRRNFGDLFSSDASDHPKRDPAASSRGHSSEAEPCPD